MNSRSIGKLVSISQTGIIAEIYSGLGNYITTNDGVRFVGEIGSYISIYDIGRTIIGEITGVVEKPAIKDRELSKPNSTRQVYISMIGEIVAGKFNFGVSKMPLIFSEINIISESDLKTVLEVEDNKIKVDDSENTRATLLEIGQSVIFQNYAVRVNIDKFFGFHFAVLGNTGSGKSNTIASIIQEIYKKTNYSAKGSKFVFIDSNGEYAQAFNGINEKNSEISVKTLLATDDENIENRLEIPVWTLSADDWAILLHATEKTQIPVLKRAIDIARILFDTNNTEDNKLSLKKHILASAILKIFNSADTPSAQSNKVRELLATNEKLHTKDISPNTPYVTGKTIQNALTISFGKMENEALIEYLGKYIRSDIVGLSKRDVSVAYNIEEFHEAVRLAILCEGSISSQRIHEYTATLVTRLETLKDGIVGKILTKTDFTSVDKYVNDILGENQVLNIDVSSLDDASAEVVTKVLAKLLLDYLKSKQQKADMPINFIIEEAHRFIRNETNYGSVGYNIFERIAKEGRKFGLLLGVSSQRPKELSKTVVSQCSNFIIHRIQNPDDLSYIQQMVPYVNQDMIKRLTYLQTGHALVFGTAINLPTLTQFPEANPKPDSENAKISEKWYIQGNTDLI